LSITNAEIQSDTLIGAFNIVTIDTTENPFIYAQRADTSSIFNFVDFDDIITSFATPNDNYFNNEEQWALLSDYLDLESIWDIEFGNTQVVVADIDGGLLYNHPDLINNIWVNNGELPEDYTDSENDTNGNQIIDMPELLSIISDCNDDSIVNIDDIFCDDNIINNVDDDPITGSDAEYIDDVIGWSYVSDWSGESYTFVQSNDPNIYININNNQEYIYPSYHGTRTAGIIAASTNNQIGISGVAGGWNENLGVKLLMVKFTYKSNTENQQINFATGAALSIQYAIDKDADVINMSWGCPEDWNVSHYFYPTIQAAYDAGIVLIAASGNNYWGTDTSYPAAWPEVIGVGAIDDTYTKWEDSCYNSNLSVVAPGVDIISTNINIDDEIPCINDEDCHDEYGSNTGTSFASPHVAGIAALLLLANPDLTPLEVKTAIESTAIQLSGYEFDESDFNNEVGYGLVDGFAALKSLFDSGDLNHDLLVNVNDVVYIVNIIIQSLTPTNYEMWAGDLNEDAIIDVLDIVMIVDIIMGSSSGSYPDGTIMFTNIISEVNQDSSYLDIWIASETIVDGIELELDVDSFGYKAIGIDSTKYVKDMAFTSKISSDSTSVKFIIYDTGGDFLADSSFGTIAKIWLTESGTTSSPDSTDFTKQEFVNMDSSGSYIDHEFGSLSDFKSFICDIDSTYCYGCTDDEALNYSPVVTYDDTSCVFLLGDMNADESLTVADIVLMNGIILEIITATAYQEFAGDMNGDGEIDVADTVILLDIIMSQRSMDRDGGEGKILISKEVNPIGVLEGEDASLNITLYNEPIIRAMLVTIDLEENYQVSSINMGERTTLMDVQHRIFDNDSKLSFILYSINGYDIEAGLGPILEVGLQSSNLGRYSQSNDGEFSEIQIASLDAELLEFNVLLSDEMASIVNSGSLPYVIPTMYSLHPAFPNPFNPIITLSYDLPMSGQISLTVYDMMGSEVTQLVNSRMEEGYHSIQWDASSFSSGVYIVKLVADDFTQTQKIALVK
jgi:subtilisin family serine protease